MLKKIVIFLLCIVMLTISCPLEMRAENEWKTPSGLSAQEFEKYCDEYFEQECGTTIPGASVAVVSKGNVVFSKGYGYSDIKKQLPSNPQSTVYEYGSVSKLFTWVSVMKLYEQGKADLNADIRQYLPSDFPLPMSFEKPITLLDLMNHQAGFDDYIIHLFSKEDGIVSLEQSLIENKVQQVYEPGFASSYSNYGAGLAGFIVENVAKEPAYEFIQEEIMRPIGMQQAVINPDISDYADIRQNKAKVYSGANGDFREENWSYVPMYPAGAANGTLEELSKFAIALLDEENHPLFEKKETMQEMLSASCGDTKGAAGMAHGFVEYDGEYPVYWHNGGTDHSSTFFAIVPETDFAIILCTNSGNLSSIQQFGFEMLQKNQVVLETPQENLPETSIVEGNYLDFREDHRGIAKISYFTRYLEPIRVRSMSQNEITIDGSKYIQVEPYVFQDVETGTKVAFQVENGKVIKYTDMLDYLPVPGWKSVAAWAKVLVLLLFAVSILVTLITLLIRIIRKRWSKREMIPTAGLLCWCALGANFVVILEKIIEWNTFQAIRGHLILNGGLGALILVCSVCEFTGGKKDSGKTLAYRFFAVFSVLALVALGTLGFFSINY